MLRFSKGNSGKADVIRTEVLFSLCGFNSPEQIWSLRRRQRCKEHRISLRDIITLFANSSKHKQLMNITSITHCAKTGTVCLRNYRYNIDTKQSSIALLELIHLHWNSSVWDRYKNNVWSLLWGYSSSYIPCRVQTLFSKERRTLQIHVRWFFSSQSLTWMCCWLILLLNFRGWKCWERIHEDSTSYTQLWVGRLYNI